MENPSPDSDLHSLSRLCLVPACGPYPNSVSRSHRFTASNPGFQQSPFACVGDGNLCKDIRAPRRCSQTASLTATRLHSPCYLTVDPLGNLCLGDRELHPSSTRPELRMQLLSRIDPLTTRPESEQYCRQQSCLVEGPMTVAARRLPHGWT